MERDQHGGSEDLSCIHVSDMPYLTGKRTLFIYRFWITVFLILLYVGQLLQYIYMFVNSVYVYLDDYLTQTSRMILIGSYINQMMLF